MLSGIERNTDGLCARERLTMEFIIWTFTIIAALSAVPLPSPRRVGVGQ